MKRMSHSILSAIRQGMGAFHITSILALLLAMMLFACTSPQHRSVLDSADSLMNARPDSALTLLNALLPDTDQMQKGDLMRFHLLRTNAENKCDTVLTARHAALMRRVCDYYDHKASPFWGDERGASRMLAHYLLGRCYDDMGEAPAALEEFHNAIDCADTTKHDCDYHTLTLIYSQEARLFYLQNLYKEQLNACERASKYALLGGDTLSAAIYLNKMASAYESAGKRDSAILVIEQSRSSFKALGRLDLASQTLPQYMDILMQCGEIRTLPALFKEYEGMSGYFDTEKEIELGMEIYYWIKGNYHLCVNNIDSARHYYQKCLHKSTTTENRMAACEGLFRLYARINQTDSLKKYAQLTVNYKDSLARESETYRVQAIQSMYRYDRHRHEAYTNKIRAEQEKKAKTFWVFVCLFIITVSIAISWAIMEYSRQRKREMNRRYEQLLADYQSSIARYRQEASDISALRNKDVGLEQLLSQKEAILASYSKRIQDLEEKLSDMEDCPPDNVTISDSFADVMSSKPFQRIAEGLEPPFPKPSESDWASLRSAVTKKSPAFYAKLGKEAVLGKDELDACILLRAGYKSKDICVLKGWAESNMSMKCGRAYAKLTGKKGSTRQLKAFLQTI